MTAEEVTSSPTGTTESPASGPNGRKLTGINVGSGSAVVTGGSVTVPRAVYHTVFHE